MLRLACTNRCRLQILLLPRSLQDTQSCCPFSVTAVSMLFVALKSRIFLDIFDCGSEQCSEARNRSLVFEIRDPNQDLVRDASHSWSKGCSRLSALHVCVGFQGSAISSKRPKFT
jgi:hypothetical protein